MYFKKHQAPKLFEHSDINKYLIDLKPDKQPLYVPIYSLRLVKVKILKAYIKTNLINGFICYFKSSAGAPILFLKKPNNSLRLYVDYQGLNNLRVKKLVFFILDQSVIGVIRPCQVTH